MNPSDITQAAFNPKENETEPPDLSAIFEIYKHVFQIINTYYLSAKESRLQCVQKIRKTSEYKRASNSKIF